MISRQFASLWLALGLLVAGPAVGEARLEWSLTLSGADPLFGGLSAIESDPSGTQITVMSDRGALFSAQVVRSSGSAVLANLVRLPFTSPTGRPMERGKNDTEGLAFGADGSRFVSTENPARVMPLAADGSTTQLDTPSSFRNMEINGSLEALAIGPDGSLYTLPERSGRYDVEFPVYRYKNGQWGIVFSIARSDAFLPVGADFGPDGRLYILERDFGPIGFRSRVISMAPDGTDIRPELLTTMGQHGNLEGLAVWRDDRGDIRLLMVADDNFVVWQRSELVEYSIRH